MGPQDWLLVKRMRFAMEQDPMTENAWLHDLRPSLGDSISVDGKEFSWEAIADKERGTRKDGNGGIAMQGDIAPQGWPRKMSVLGYAALKVNEAGNYKLNAGFSLAVRVQIILNGQPVDNRQIVALEPGIYPLLLAVRWTEPLGGISSHILRWRVKKKWLPARDPS